MRKIFSLVLVIILVVSGFSGINIFAQENLNGQFMGATLNLGTTLTIDYYVTLSEKNNDVQVRFTSSSGRITTVDGVYDDNYATYKFSYTGINPQCMADIITAELIYNGNVIAIKEDYSVKKYCDSLITKTAGELGYNSQQLSTFRTLIADMLFYGNSAQKYVGYNIQNPADASEWVGIFRSEFYSAKGVKKIEGNTDENNKVKSLGLNMANVNKIYFKLALENDALIKLNGETVEKTSLKNNNDGTFTLYTKDINATEFDDVYTLIIEKDGKVISKVQYNVYAYIMAKYNDVEVGEIVKALYNYGASAENYVKAMAATSQGGDFNLEVEDNLKDTGNLIPEKSSSFETALNASDSGWTRKVGKIITSEIIEEEFGNCLHFEKSTADADGSYSSLLFDIMPYITHGGLYKISFKFKVEGADETIKPFNGIVRTGGETSFSKASSTNFFTGLNEAIKVKNGQWATYETELYVDEDDIGKGEYWGVGLSGIQKTITDVYIDDFVVIEQVYVPINSAETWVSNEITLISDVFYDDPFNDVDVDLILTNGETKYTVPGFWDGNRKWKVRFTCPEAGTWTYTTVCTDTENNSLHNISNTFVCTEYSGDLEIYKRGFVKTLPDTKYFVYADNTPFFYLGDTHWSLGSESVQMVETIIEQRVEQGYNVFQSQPLGVKFNLKDGLNSADIEGFKDYDSKFKLIADAGMVHVNSQFFFVSVMENCIQNFGGYDMKKTLTASYNGREYTFYDLSDTAKAYLEKISRYWVARYSSYPVMWTLAQEVDNDYYWTEGSENQWCYVNNPYRYVAQYIGKYDPYNSPLSAHQEGADNVAASNSAFLDIDEHTWWANQWKPKFNDLTSDLLAAAKDYWNNGQGKPIILFEGRYVYLWTKDFGGRAQGWAAFLNGMYGHGYGAQDTWSYLNVFSENEDTNYADGVDVITKEEKQEKTWEDALEFASSYELGYMKDFFENTVGDWYNLIPRFDDANYLTRETKKVSVWGSTRTGTSLAYIASKEDSSKVVVYFYNFSDVSLAARPNAAAGSGLGYEYDFGTLTGTLGNLKANSTYKFVWFNPRTNEYSEESVITANAEGKITVPAKSKVDMVFYLYADK